MASRELEAVASAPLTTPSGDIDHRSKDYRDLVGMTPRTSELLVDVIDGEEYAYRRERQCKVCSAPPELTELIDTLLIYPKSYAETLELATPIMDKMGISPEDRPSYHSIRNHQQRHLPFEKAAIRRIAERRATERGRRILDGADRILTAEAFYEVVAQKGWEQLVNGTLKPSVFESMAAIRLLDNLERTAESETSVQELLTQLNIIIEAVRKVVPQEMWNQIATEIQAARDRLQEEAGAEAALA